jgi:uncharacterized protein (TIGR00297 family)
LFVNADYIGGLAFIVIGAVLAWKSKMLSLSGAVMAIFAGSCLTLGFGIKGIILIGTFFVSSSLLSKWNGKKKSSLGEIHEKGSVRDWAQVFANGGIAAASGLAAFIWPTPLFILALGISLASANSDTWASELGTLSKRPPLSIRNFRRVATGTSGAISLGGTVAGFFGSLLLAVVATILFQLSLEIFFFILFFGFFGMLIDTILGAYLQAEYICKKCGLHIEKPIHCQEKAVLCKGRSWIRNDTVNFISNLSAVLLGLFFYSGF